MADLLFAFFLVNLYMMYMTVELEGSSLVAIHRDAMTREFYTNEWLNFPCCLQFDIRVLIYRMFLGSASSAQKKRARFLSVVLLMAHIHEG